MAIHDLDISSKEILWGNILLIICCAFYLVWWLLAFKPAGAVRGMRTGWLLIPAFAAGMAAIIFTGRGILSASVKVKAFPGGWLLLGGVAAYIILFAITRMLLKRPVTTELFLIVGWAVLALSEINALYGTGRFSHGLAVAFAVVVVAAALISLVCYVLYYNLGNTSGYIDGMIPLLMVALVMSGLSVALAF